MKHNTLRASVVGRPSRSSVADGRRGKTFEPDFVTLVLLLLPHISLTRSRLLESPVIA